MMLFILQLFQNQLSKNYKRLYLKSDKTKKKKNINMK